MAPLPARVARRLLVGGLFLLGGACATGTHEGLPVPLSVLVAPPVQRPLPPPDAPVIVDPGSSEATLEVVASAYNSVRGQTDSTPDIAAWGDRLRPGVRSIAVSHDLIPLGLDRGALVRIDQLPGEWRVLDRMHSRWSRRIDLYFGHDVHAARLWGRRPVTIRWTAER